MMSPLKEVGVYTKYCIWCHQFYLSGSILIANRQCSVTNTKCKPNIICHSLLNINVHNILQRCNDICHLLSDVSLNFNHP